MKYSVSPAEPRLLYHRPCRMLGCHLRVGGGEGVSVGGRGKEEG